MPQLPMTAFRIDGNGGDFVELIINEVYGFPHELTYPSGYGADGTISIHAGEFSVLSSRLWFSTGELYDFYSELQNCYDLVEGKAELNFFERDLELSCEFDKFGHVNCRGQFQPQADTKNILIFDILSDQTCIRETLSQLEKVYDVFGGRQGKR